MKAKKIIAACVVFMALAPVAMAARSAFPSVDGLVSRRVPWLSGKISFVRKASQADQFTLKSLNGRPVVEANDALSAAVGLNWYLKYYCHRQMSHLGDNLAPVDTLPVVRQPETHSSQAEMRYALNYCTQNYTYSFYSWSDWERELDWMALHGVNMMLVCSGEEAVWQNTLRRLGYTDAEIGDFITGPAYTAWWLMGNIEGLGGPMPQAQIDERVVLTRKVLGRMREFGIQPMLPGFFGMVPSAMKSRSKAKISQQGLWCGLRRPDYIDPNDPEFSRMARIFYAETRRLYGSDIRYFSGDPFHEGGSTEGVDVAAAGVVIQREMLRAFPRATWVLQGWQDNPKAELISRMDKKRLLIQELNGENTAEWEKRKGYEGTPFAWCVICSSGERPGLCGKIERIASEWHRVATSPFSGLLRGVGIMPEGIRNNPVIYELTLELPWHKGEVNVSDWLKDYAYARYGGNDADTQAAWQAFMKTVYNPDERGKLLSPCEDVLFARPERAAAHQVSIPGSTVKPFDTSLYINGTNCFMRAAKLYKGSATYLADAIQVRSQAVSIAADSIYEQMAQAVANNDSDYLKLQAGIMLSQLDYLDNLFDQSPLFRLSTYVEQAEKCTASPQVRRNNVRNLLMLVTYWGGDPARNEEILQEYAYKEWSGLTKTFYKRRWQTYFDYAMRKMRGENVNKPDYYKLDREWVEQAMRQYDSKNK